MHRVVEKGVLDRAGQKVDAVAAVLVCLVASGGASGVAALHEEAVEAVPGADAVLEDRVDNALRWRRLVLSRSDAGAGASGIREGCRSSRRCGWGGRVGERSACLEGDSGASAAYLVHRDEQPVVVGRGGPGCDSESS